MSRSLVFSETGNIWGVKVFRDSETKEFIARIYPLQTGKYYAPADYFATDRADAIGSARDMLARQESNSRKGSSVPGVFVNPRPRLGTAKPRRASSATGKRPTARLVSRRLKNTRKGVFPNPAFSPRRNPVLRQKEKIVRDIGRENKYFLIQEQEGRMWKTQAYAASIESAKRIAKLYADETGKTVRVVK